MLMLETAVFEFILLVERDTLDGEDFVELAGSVYHFSAEPLSSCKWCWCSVPTQHLL